MSDPDPYLLAAAALRMTARMIVEHPSAGSVDRMLDLCLCEITGGSQDDTQLGSTLPADPGRWGVAYATAHDAVPPSSRLSWTVGTVGLLREAADRLDPRRG